MDFWTDFSQHYNDLYRFVYRLLGRSAAAEDVVQETFLRAARNHAKLLEGEPARRWLFVVARNLCVSHMRHAARHPEVPLEAGPETWSQRPNPAEAVDASGLDLSKMPSLSCRPRCVRLLCCANTKVWTTHRSPILSDVHSEL